MRADRLVSLLLLLQTRGRMTARDLADELEVSERTIYRDIDALSLAGIPVYGEAGRAGGYALLDDYRTSLTGLSEGEARALLLLSLPTPLADLGIAADLKAALLKLQAALPPVYADVSARAHNRVLLDPIWWEQTGEPAPHLSAVYRVVWEDRRLRIRYRTWSTPNIERDVDAYALVAKAGVWHLIAGGERLRVYRVADLLAAEPLDEPFTRRVSFDLAAFWAAYCAARSDTRASYAVTVRVSPRVLPELSHYFEARVRADIAGVQVTDAEGWVTVELPFASLEEARERMLGYGGGVEVLRPHALRLSVQDYAEQIARRYA